MRGVIDELKNVFGHDPEFPTRPYPNDTLTRRSNTEVEFVTAPNREGLGTYSGIARNDQAISGVAILLPEDDMNLLLLAVRLPPENQALASIIVRVVERDRGYPCRGCVIHYDPMVTTFVLVWLSVQGFWVDYAVYATRQECQLQLAAKFGEVESKEAYKCIARRINVNPD